MGARNHASTLSAPLEQLLRGVRSDNVAQRAELIEVELPDHPVPLEDEGHGPARHSHSPSAPRGCDPDTGGGRGTGAPGCWPFRRRRSTSGVSPGDRQPSRDQPARGVVAELGEQLEPVTVRRAVEHRHRPVQSQALGGIATQLGIRALTDGAVVRRGHLAGDGPVVVLRCSELAGARPAVTISACSSSCGAPDLVGEAETHQWPRAPGEPARCLRHRRLPPRRPRTSLSAKAPSLRATLGGCYVSGLRFRACLGSNGVVCGLVISA